MTAGPRAGRSRKERCGGRQTDCSCSDLPRALCARTHIHIIIIIISFTFPMNFVNLWVSRLRFSLYISELILLPSSRPFFTEMCWIVKLPKCRKLPPPPPVWENIGTWHFDYSITICIVCIKRFTWLWHTTLSSSVNVRCLRRTSCHFRCHIVILSLSLSKLKCSFANSKQENVHLRIPNKRTSWLKYCSLSEKVIVSDLEYFHVTFWYVSVQCTWPLPSNFNLIPKCNKETQIRQISLGFINKGFITTNSIIIVTSLYPRHIGLLAIY